MSEKTRKRRVDAMECTFKFCNCKDIKIESEGKTYIFEPVIMKKAKAVAKYEQPVFSLYRDLHKTKCAKEIYGIRAIDIAGFNDEGHCCKITMVASAGKDELVV